MGERWKFGRRASPMPWGHSEPYTFYLQSEMKPERVGDQAAWLASPAGQRVLFYRGAVLVDAIFSRQSAMSAAQLRELAGETSRGPREMQAICPVLSHFCRMPTTFPTLRNTPWGRWR